ncbi:hypothetical protein SCANM63S_09378 [Streptomyces canarius]
MLGGVRGLGGLRVPGGVQGLLLQQRGVQGLEFRARVGAEGVGEGTAGGLVGGEGVGRAARVAQGTDEEGVQGLVVRVDGGQFPQLRYGLPGAAEGQGRGGAGAGRLQAQGLGAGGGGAVGEVGEGRAVPEGEGLGEGAVGGGRVAGGEGLGAGVGEAFEDVEVHLVLGRFEAVTARGGGDGVPAEGTAEAADEGLEGGGGVLGRVVRPDLLDEGVGGGGAAGAEGQGGEESPQAPAADGYGGALVVCRLGHAQDSVPHLVIVAGGGGRSTGVSVLGAPGARHDCPRPDAPRRHAGSCATGRDGPAGAPGGPSPQAHAPPLTPLA